MTAGQLLDPLKRGARTFLQAALGVGLSMFLTLNLAPGELPSGDVAKRIGIAMGVAGVIATVTFAQNALEEASGKSLLK